MHRELHDGHIDHSAGQTHSATSTIQDLKQQSHRVQGRHSNDLLCCWRDGPDSALVSEDCAGCVDGAAEVERGGWESEPAAVQACQSSRRPGARATAPSSLSESFSVRALVVASDSGDS